MRYSTDIRNQVHPDSQHTHEYFHNTHVVLHIQLSATFWTFNRTDEKSLSN